MKIRVVTTSSSGKAVQIVQYQNSRRKIIKHIGSAHGEESLNELIILAEEWIKAYSGQQSIFADEQPNNLILLNHCEFLGVKYHFFYKQISAIVNEMKLHKLHALLTDLAIIRIFEPASKLRSLELMENYFSLQHSRKTYYKIAPLCLELKETVEKLVINFAKAQYDFNFDMVFYDVTTLYFETFEEDDLRKNGHHCNTQSNRFFGQ